MKLLTIIALALVGGFALYDSDEDFRNNVDNFVQELETQQHAENASRPEFESTAAGRPNTNAYFGLSDARIGNRYERGSSNRPSAQDMGNARHEIRVAQQLVEYNNRVKGGGHPDTRAAISRLHRAQTTYNKLVNALH